MRFLRAPEGTLSVGITDPAVADGGSPTVRDFGPVRVAFAGRATRAGRPSRRYTIDGPSLEQRGGALWVDRDTGFLLGCEIQMPDEEGMVSGRLELLGTEPMTEAGWLVHRANRLRP
jgi:hypothetical protein